MDGMICEVVDWCENQENLTMDELRSCQKWEIWSAGDLAKHQLEPHVLGTCQFLWGRASAYKSVVTRYDFERYFHKPIYTDPYRKEASGILRVDEANDLSVIYVEDLCRQIGVGRGGVVDVTMRRARP